MKAGNQLVLPIVRAVRAGCSQRAREPSAVGCFLGWQDRASSARTCPTTPNREKDRLVGQLGDVLRPGWVISLQVKAARLSRAW